MNKIKILAVAFAILFMALLSIRLGIYGTVFKEAPSTEIENAAKLPDKEVWMNVTQNGHKIGYSYTSFSANVAGGYRFSEKMFLRVNTMGLTQDLQVHTDGELLDDLSLAVFNFKLHSGRISFSANGRVEGNTLTVTLGKHPSVSELNIDLDRRVFLTASILPAVMQRGPGPGDTLQFDVFDPATMQVEPMTVRVMEKETIKSQGIVTEATKFALEFKGVAQMAWVSENGDVLKESGLLGIVLEKTYEFDALSGIPETVSEDLTQVAAVTPQGIIDRPLKKVQLRLRITGVDFRDLNMSGERQVLKADVLTITKENLKDPAYQLTVPVIDDNMNRYMISEPFIQSDNAAIIRIVDQNLTDRQTALEKVETLVAWIQKNIKKGPVLSVPDAMITLESRVGDCNEHAVLFAALARAAGIPARVEAGLVYMKGRFYYHAWNSVFIGKWLTVDALFNQIPADVTHVRLISGSQRNQLDLIKVVGKINIDIL